MGEGKGEGTGGRAGGGAAEGAARAEAGAGAGAAETKSAATARPEEGKDAKPKGEGGGEGGGDGGGEGGGGGEEEGGVKALALPLHPPDRSYCQAGEGAGGRDADPEALAALLGGVGRDAPPARAELEAWLNARAFEIPRHVPFDASNPARGAHRGKLREYFLCKTVHDKFAGEQAYFFPQGPPMFCTVVDAMDLCVRANRAGRFGKGEKLTTVPCAKVREQRPFVDIVVVPVPSS
jgi:hypothetical protein